MLLLVGEKRAKDLKFLAFTNFMDRKVAYIAQDFKWLNTEITSKFQLLSSFIVIFTSCQ